MVYVPRDPTAVDPLLRARVEGAIERATAGAEDKLCVWSVYCRPLDFPEGYVVRMFILDRPTDVSLRCGSLELARKVIPAGLYCQPRQAGDDRALVEVWF